jgi:SM-20-related protein
VTTLTLSPDLQVEQLSAAFARERRLHIPGLLAADSAEFLAGSLETDDLWKTTVAAGQDWFELPLADRRAADPTKQAWLDDVKVDGAKTGMQYVFDTRRLGLGEDPLDAVLQVLNSEPFLNLMRAITGDDRIHYADAQASRYRPGHLLTGHNDNAPGKNRLYAYVLNLTRNWRMEWGGLLAFEGQDGHVVQAFTPAFNAVNLFAVPARHCVTQVAEFAQADRLSITGWLRSNDPVGPQL